MSSQFIFMPPINTMCIAIFHEKHTVILDIIYITLSLMSCDASVRMLISLLISHRHSSHSSKLFSCYGFIFNCFTQLDTSKDSIAILQYYDMLTMCPIRCKHNMLIKIVAIDFLEI